MRDLTLLPGTWFCTGTWYWQINLQPGARTPPVEKTLERYNDHIPLLNFSVISLVVARQRATYQYTPVPGTSTGPCTFIPYLHYKYNRTRYVSTSTRQTNLQQREVLYRTLYKQSLLLCSIPGEQADSLNRQTPREITETIRRGIHPL